MDFGKLNQIKLDNDKWKKWAVVSTVVIIVLMLGVVAVAILALTSKNWGEGLFFMSKLGIIGLIFMGIAVAAVTCLLIGLKKNMEYREAYKAYFAPKIIPAVFEECQYNSSEGLDPNEILKLGIFRWGNTYESEDFVIGRHRDVNFCQADVRIAERDERDNLINIFFGRWMIFGFSKEFSATTVIVGKGAGRALNIPRDSGLKKIETESVDFNQRFKVYAGDGAEMFYLLNPKIIERIQELQEKYGEKIILTFMGNELHVAMAGKNYLEPPREKGEIFEDKELERLSMETRAIAEIVDLLELDRGVFKDYRKTQ